MPATKKMSDLVTQLWASVAGPRPRNQIPEVVVHDPEAKLPRDLDDPFFDRDVQSRMANVIAHTGPKKQD